MNARAVSAGLVHRLRHPQTTVRWRLTLLYGGLFLVCGAALLGITYTLLAHATVTNQAFHGFVSQVRAPPGARRAPGRPNFIAPPPAVRKLLRSRAGRQAIITVGANQRISDLHQLEVESVIALAIMAVISGALGWVVAGRVLAPLVTITATTQQISEANLHERLAMAGPRDELRVLADTIDGLLERLQGAFDSQRRFVANASHELRTPLTAARALLEMVISDPDASVETFRQVCGQVLEEGEQQEQLIEALLALANGQRGIDHRERVDLDAITRDVVSSYELEAAANGVGMNVSLQPTRLAGDGRLIERLVKNLLDNAIRHNRSGGHVYIRVGHRDGYPALSIANTGPVVPADQVDRLLQPFQRLEPDRVGHREGLGLGLSIVAAIVSAHGGALAVVPGAAGGLEIEARFPPAADGDRPALPAGAGQSEAAPAVGGGGSGHAHNVRIRT